MLCFIDYSKAFDCVKWESMWRVLREMGVPEHLVLMIKSLYEQSSATISINNVTSEAFKAQKGVRQGCILSPDLFNLYGEYIMRKALENWEGGIAIGGKKFTNLRYADDTTLIARSTPEMNALLQRVEIESKLLGLEINRAKTKIMIIDRANRMPLNEVQLGLETVHDFVYLGSCITENGNCEIEIRRRIGMAKTAMSKLDKVWKNRAITKMTKLRLVKTLVFSIFLYGVETLTLKNNERQKIDAFEMWCWRKLLGIPWTARRTNASILQELKIEVRLSTICLQRILRFFGHISRRGEDGLERLVVSGTMEGQRGRGRSPTRWTDQVKRATGLSVTDALRTAECRDKWRSLVQRFQRGHDPQS